MNAARDPAFASDNAAGMPAPVLSAFVAANDGWAAPYGDDRWTVAATARIRETLGAPDAEVLFVATGTAANLVALSTVLGHEAGVVCADTAHLNVDESVAPQRFVGAKLYLADAVDGRLDRSAVEAAIGQRRTFGPAPQVLSLTQATERGTVYGLEDLRSLVAVARDHEMLVHLDGARLANAVATLGTPPSSLTSELGIDFVTLGGSKSGLPVGEAIVFLDPELARPVRYVAKVAMQLMAKTRFVAAPFAALLEDDLWLEGARHANAMATRLAEHVRDLPGVEIVHPVEANMVFARLPDEVIEALWARYEFYLGAPGVARWLTSWATREEDVDQLADAVSRETARHASARARDGARS